MQQRVRPKRRALPIRHGRRSAPLPVPSPAAVIVILVSGAVLIGLLFLLRAVVRRPPVLAPVVSIQVPRRSPPPVAEVRQRRLPVPGDRLVAAVVENHVAARPAEGLESAAVVYEAPVEGGITRYLAIFRQPDLPATVGPIRSLRPYLIDWAAEWQAVLVHSGGSPAALQRLRARSLVSLNEISAAGVYFWRERGRRRPHDLFTSAEKLTQAFADLSLPETSTFTPWAVVPEPPLQERPPDHVAVLIRSPEADYCVGYRYHQGTNSYERWLGGTPQRGRDGAPLWAKAVVAQVIPAQVIDREGRLSLQLGGPGEAWVFANGQRTHGGWRRQAGRTEFTDAAGTIIGFPGGPVWLSIVTNAAAVAVPDPSLAMPGDAVLLRCE